MPSSDSENPSRPRLEASPELMAELAAASELLEKADPIEVIRWASDRFGKRLTMATAFGPEGCLILHWLSSVAPTTFVFNLETGYQFKETLELRDRIRDRYGITVSYESPETTVEEYERKHGGPLYRTDPATCCGDRKIVVIERVLSNFDAWMSGIRRDQSLIEQMLRLLVGIKNLVLLKSHHLLIGQSPKSGTKSFKRMCPTILSTTKAM